MSTHRTRAVAMWLCTLGMANALGSAGAAGAEQAPRVHDGLSAPAKAWAKAMEAGDLAALRAMHVPAATAYPPGQDELAGVDAIMKDYADLFAKYTVRVTDEDAHWIAQGPLIVSWGRSTMILHPKAGGSDVTNHSRFTDAAIETDGHWRYVVDHASQPTGK